MKETHKALTVSQKKHDTPSKTKLSIVIASLLATSMLNNVKADNADILPQLLRDTFIDRFSGHVFANTTDGYFVVDQAASGVNVGLINYSTFNLGADQSVYFIQNPNQVLVNNVANNQVSTILGVINPQQSRILSGVDQTVANGGMIEGVNYDPSVHSGGTVFILNQSGVIFGANAQVNLGGLVVSTLGLTEQSRNELSQGNLTDVSNLNLNFNGGGQAADLVVDGEFNIVNNVAFIGAFMDIGGTLAFSGETARLHIGSGESASITLGNNLWQLEITGELAQKINSSSENAIDISADIQKGAGQTLDVIVSQKAQANLFENAINLSGITRANNLTVDVDGNLLLTSGVVDVDTLNVTTGGDILQSSPSSINASQTNINATNGDVVLVSADNDFDTFGIIASSVDLRDLDDIVLSRSSVGDMTMTAGGAVFQIGAITAGTAQINAAGQRVTLDNAENDFDTFGVVASSVDMRDLDDITLSRSSVGNLTVRAEGAVTQTGAITASTAQINAAGQRVTLDNANNDFDIFGASASSLTLRDKDSIELGNIRAGAFELTTQGNVRQQANTSIVSTGTTFMNVADNVINLSGSANDFSTFAANGRLITVNDINGITLGQISATQRLDVISGGAVNQVGAITAGRAQINAAGQAVILDNADNDFDTFGVIASSLDLRDRNDINFARSSVGDMTVSAEGAVTQTGAIIAGTAQINAFGQVTLDHAENDFDIFGARASSLTLTDKDSIELGNIRADDFELTTQGNVRQQANTNIVVSGTTFMNVVDNVINLRNSTNDFGTFAANGRLITVNDINSIVLGETSATQRLDVIAGGAVTQSGAITAATTQINAAGQDVILDNVNNDFSTISVFANSVTVVDKNALEADIIRANKVVLLSEGNLVANTITADNRGGITDGIFISRSGTINIDELLFDAEGSTEFSPKLFFAAGSSSGDVDPTAAGRQTVAVRNILNVDENMLGVVLAPGTTSKLALRTGDVSPKFLDQNVLPSFTSLVSEITQRPLSLDELFGLFSAN